MTPVAIPELFSGEGSARWDDWIDHFDRIADVNDWDDAKKKKWPDRKSCKRVQEAV